MRRGLAIGTSAVLALLSACGDNLSYVALPTIEPSTQSVLVISEGPSKLDLFFYPADGLPPLELSHDDTSRVTLLQYEQSLDELGLSAGRQARTDPTACGAWAPPEPTATDVLDVSSGDLVFARQARGPTGLDRIALARSCPCRAFGLEVVELGNHGSVYGLDRRPDGRWVVLTPATVFFLDASLVVTSTINAPDGVVSMKSMALLEDGRLRIVSANGVLVEHTPTSDALVPIAQAATSSVIELASSGDGSEAIIADDVNRVFHFTEAGVEAIPGDTSDAGSNQHGAVAWLGGEHFVFSRRRGSGFFERQTRADRWEHMPWESTFEPISRLRHVDGVGLFLVTKVNSLYVRAEGSDVLENLLLDNLEDFVDALHAFAAFEEGWVAGGAAAIRQWHPRTGVCPPFTFDASLTVTFEHMVSVDDTTLVAGGVTPASSPTRLYIFTAKK